LHQFQLVGERNEYFKVIYTIMKVRQSNMTLQFIMLPDTESLLCYRSLLVLATFHVVLTQTL